MRFLESLAKAGFDLFLVVIAAVVFAAVRSAESSTPRPVQPVQVPRELMPTYTPQVQAAPVALPTATPAPPPTPAKLVQITSVETRIIEQNDTWWKYSWKVTIRNDGDQDGEVSVTLTFLDADGFKLDEGGASDLVVAAHSEQAFSDTTLVDTEFAPNVEAVTAEINHVVVPGTFDVIQR
jgi:hypothetical protein